jgi:hypothetical protein
LVLISFYSSRTSYYEIFKDFNKKCKEFSSTKSIFSIFKEFSRTTLKFKEFSRPVRTMPLLFPTVSLGWDRGIPHNTARRTAIHQTVSQLEYYSYRLAV